MNLTDWHDFFLAAVGAGAALAGLIIVAMSPNVAAIIAIPSMTSRAAATIADLTLTVVVGCVALVPGQPLEVVGAEVVVASMPVVALALRSGARIVTGRPPGTTTTFSVFKAGLGFVPAAAALVGGTVLLLGGQAGLYVLAASVVVAFAASITNAWVLLVEILR